MYFVLTPNFYNWTMSYRLDSDIRRPYGRIRDVLTQKIISPPVNPDSAVPWRKTNGTKYNVSREELEIIKEKSQIAAWFVSHCDTRSKRETLVKELQRHFEVIIIFK